MKKQIIAAGLAVLMAVTMAGCGSSAKKDGEITLGTYKGIRVGQSVRDQVTDELIEEQAQMALEEYGSLIDKGSAAEEGDTVNIDFTGYIDGEAFEGGSGTGSQFVLGEGNFIEGFQEPIAGHVAGEEFEVQVTFPENYQYEEMRGKDATFKMKLNSVKVMQLPELSDDFVSQYFGKLYSVNTVDEFYQYIEDQLVYYYVQQVVSKTLLESCEVKTWPEGKVDELSSNVYQEYETYIPSMYGVDLKTYYTAYGFTEETFKELIQSSAEDEIKTQMIVKKIAEKENLQLTDEEYQKAAEQMADAYQADSVEELESTYGKEEIQMSALNQKVFDWIVDHVEYYDDSAELSTSSSAGQSGEDATGETESGENETK